MSNSLQPRELQHARPPCPSPTPEVYSNSCPSSWWCHPAIFVKMWKSKRFTRSSIPRKYLFPLPPLLQWRARIHGGSRKASGLFGYSKLQCGYFSLLELMGMNWSHMWMSILLCLLCCIYYADFIKLNLAYPSPWFIFLMEDSMHYCFHSC